jgi:photosystem II stability/assembly factor-like uncharacterized protein
VKDAERLSVICMVPVVVRSVVFAALILVGGCGGSSPNRRAGMPTASPTVAATVSPIPTSTPLGARAWAIDRHQVVRSDDGGLTWSPPLLTIADATLQGVAFVDRDTGWVVGGSEFGFGTALLHTLDGGATWTSQLENVTGVAAEFGFFDIASTNGQHAVAVGAAQQGVAIYAPPPLIVVTDDAGAHWHAVEIHPIRRNGTLRSLCLTNSGAGIAVGYTISGGIVVTTTDGGATWTDISDTTGFAGSDTTLITSTACAAPAQFWISGVNIGFVGAGAHSDLLYSPDGGTTWSERTPGIGNVTGSTFQLLPLAFTENGVGWTIPGPPPPFDSEGISPFILHTVDAGEHWNEQAIPQDFHGALNALAFVDDQQGVAVGAGALVTVDGGRAWQPASFASSVGPLLDVAIVP